MWKGTEEILKPKPTSMSPRPASTSGSAFLAAGEAAIRSRLVEPVAP